MNITSELQTLKERDCMGTQVGADGIPPLQGRHMIVCLGGYKRWYFFSFRPIRTGAFFFAKGMSHAST